VAALVKQIPVFEEMRLGPDGRLQREGLPLEMSAYDRRAVAKGVQLARASGGSCTIFTLGPPSAEDCLREAIAYGADDGVLITDPAFAGSDTLATARALAHAIEHVEQARGAAFDLVLLGRNSVDADTGQVGPEIAQLLDLPFVTGVKQLELQAIAAHDESALVARVGLEHDDAWVDATITLPALLSTAERLIDPCKIKDPAVWATVDAARISRVTAADLGDGPWGQAGSPTWVGETRVEAVDRDGVRLDGTIAAQVVRAVSYIADRGALHTGSLHDEVDRSVPPAKGDTTDDAVVPLVAVLVEADRSRLTRELLTGAARLAADIGGRVVVLGETDAVATPDELASWGADEIVGVRGDDLVEEDVARTVTAWASDRQPWAILVGGTAWGREVASRVAAALGAGLTGDAVGFAVDAGRLVAWKPAFGGSLVAAIHAESPVQMATVRAGVLGTYQPRAVAAPVPIGEILVEPRRRVTVISRTREDNFDDLLSAEMVVGVGKGVDPAHYGELDELVELLGAELGATRKVTDNGWMPHARQLGITGHSISPRLYIAIGTSGKYNHMVGVRSAGTILAINPDPDSLLFAVSDIGIVGDWREVVPILVRQLRVAMAAAGTIPPPARSDAVRASLPAEPDPFDEFNRAMGAGIVETPYPDFQAQRRLGPIHGGDGFDLSGDGGEGGDDLADAAGLDELPPIFTAFSFDAVQQVLRDGETFSSSGYRLFMGPVLGHSILEMDEPEHHTYRALLQQAFTRKVMERWENELVEPIVHGLIDQFVQRGRADLVRELHFPFPLQVIAALLGLPDDDLPMFHRLGVELISVAIDYERAVAASVKLGEYFGSILEQRYDEPADDMISVLAFAEHDGIRLTPEEIFSFLRLLLPAGAETTYRSSSNLMFGLLTHPDQLDAVRRDRSLVPQAIEEGLRWECPLLMIMRTAVKEAEVCGVPIPAGAMVITNMGSANHDETRWDHPEQFDIFREQKPHMAFAAGPHLCLGMHLARMETKVVVNALLDRLPNVRIDPDAEAPFITGMTFRAPPALPVVFD